MYWRDTRIEYKISNVQAIHQVLDTLRGIYSVSGQDNIQQIIKYIIHFIFIVIVSYDIMHGNLPVTTAMDIKIVYRKKQI